LKDDSYPDSSGRSVIGPALSLWRWIERARDSPIRLQYAASEKYSCAGVSGFDLHDRKHCRTNVSESEGAFRLSGSRGPLL
jgi:hypothetical protein